MKRGFTLALTATLAGCAARPAATHALSSGDASVTDMRRQLADDMSKAPTIATVGSLIKADGPVPMSSFALLPEQRTDDRAVSMTNSPVIDVKAALKNANNVSAPASHTAPVAPVPR